MLTTRVLIPAGVLGLGFDQAALDRGVAAAPDIICIDGGSTDSGPFYLGTSTSKYARSVSKAEWRALMVARQQAGVPLVIGSCGTCGTRCFRSYRKVPVHLEQNCLQIPFMPCSRCVLLELAQTIPPLVACGQYTA